MTAKKKLTKYELAIIKIAKKIIEERKKQTKEDFLVRAEFDRLLERWFL